MTKKRGWRWLALAVAVPALALAVFLVGVAWAQPSGGSPAAGCNYPSSVDTYLGYLPGDRLINTEVNKWLCTINALQALLGATGSVGELGVRTCQEISVDAGARKSFTLTLPATLLGTEMVLPAVADDVSPPRLDPDGVEDISGDDAIVWVFNRDADATRTGRLCVHVLPTS